MLTEMQEIVVVHYTVNKKYVKKTFLRELDMRLDELSQLLGKAGKRAAKRNIFVDTFTIWLDKDE